MITKLCLDMVQLFEEAREQEWVLNFKSVIRILESDGINNQTVNLILKHFAGMGSLNDLVLYKDGIPDTRRNERLYVLRKELYDECMKVKT